MGAVRQLESGKPERGERERESERERASEQHSVLPPLQTPSSVRGKRPGGTEPEKERDAGTEDGEGDPALRVRSRDEEGRKDRLTHGLTVSKSGSSQSRAQGKPESRAKLPG